MLSNLVANARDAMPKGGVVRIGLRPAARAGRPEPDRVELEVTDAGIGMDAATRKRLFQPLFTTKSAGRGSGLGLATCYSIVVRHGGDIIVRSAPGRGSTFLVHLPLMQQEQQARASE